VAKNNLVETGQCGVNYPDIPQISLTNNESGKYNVPNYAVFLIDG